jgi:hypothetical protein
MEWCGCQAVPVFRWSQLVHINPVRFSAMDKPEAMGYDNLALE